MMVTGGIKNGGKIGRLKDNNRYVLDNIDDDFKDKLLKMFRIMEKRQRYWKRFVFTKKIKENVNFFK